MSHRQYDGGPAGSVASSLMYSIIKEAMSIAYLYYSLSSLKRVI